jgi:hypothetical protein
VSGGVHFRAIRWRKVRRNGNVGRLGPACGFAAAECPHFRHIVLFERSLTNRAASGVEDPKNAAPKFLTSSMEFLAAARVIPVTLEPVISVNSFKYRVFVACEGTHPKAPGTVALASLDAKKSKVRLPPAQHLHWREDGEFANLAALPAREHGS